jgi:metal-responsive CopG/Arc/MetJ family transcriptional regulator
MKTVQMTLEPELVARVDKAARRLGLSRSAFTRRALTESLNRLTQQELEERHRDGYRRHPARRAEFDAWETEQVWPE